MTSHLKFIYLTNVDFDIFMFAHKLMFSSSSSSSIIVPWNEHINLWRAKLYYFEIGICWQTEEVAIKLWKFPVHKFSFFSSSLACSTITVWKNATNEKMNVVMMAREKERKKSWVRCRLATLLKIIKKLESLLAINEWLILTIPDYTCWIAVSLCFEWLRKSCDNFIFFSSYLHGRVAIMRFASRLK